MGNNTSATSMSFEDMANELESQETVAATVEGTDTTAEVTPELKSEETTEPVEIKEGE